MDGDYHKVLIAPSVRLNPESLLHVVAGCQQCLDRLPEDKSLQPVINVHFSLYADVNGFLNPSIITGENYRPDLLFQIRSNLNNNAVRKKEKYLNLIKEMA